MAAEISKENKRGLPLPVIIVAAATLLGAGTFWWLSTYARSAPQEVVLTPEAKAYVKNLRLAGVEMKATTSYLGQDVVEITGQVTNEGDRTLRQVDLNCVFYDPYGQVVLRQRVPIVRPKEGPLEAGQTRDFRLPFDTVPKNWSQSMPQLVIAQILFD